MPPDASETDPTIVVRPPRGTLQPGTKILNNTYVIEQFIAKGGMGEVYKAEHVDLKEKSAIKIILAQYADDPLFVKLFIEEARKLRLVDHRAIVKYEGLLRDEAGALCLIMEFVDGASLAKIIEKQQLNAEEIVRLLKRLAQGLAAVYECGIKAHRDISPANIIVPEGKIDQAKIIDFGIAKSADPELTVLPTGDFAGKFSYASPEQIGLYAAADQVDQRSDIYSLGLVVGAAALGFGKRIDMGNNQHTAILKRQSVPDLSAVPEVLRPLVSKMLQPRPEQRFQTMKALLNAIDKIDLTPAPPPPTSEAGWLRRYAPWLVGAGVAGVAAVAGVLVFVAPRSSVSSDDVRAQMKQVIAGYRCADLSYSVEPDRGVTLSGYVSTAGDLDALNRRVAAVRGIANPHFDVRVRAWPFCEATALLRPLIDKSELSGAALGLASPEGAAHVGTPLVLDVKAPAFDGYAYVDYFTADGEVLHLFPNDKDALNFRPARNNFVLGQPPQAGMRRCWTLSGSTGEQLVTYIASSGPLFPALRPAHESAKDYLADLTVAVNASTDEIARTLFFDLQPAAAGRAPQACSTN